MNVSVSSTPQSVLPPMRMRILGSAVQDRIPEHLTYLLPTLYSLMNALTRSCIFGRPGTRSRHCQSDTPVNNSCARSPSLPRIRIVATGQYFLINDTLFHSVNAVSRGTDFCQCQRVTQAHVERGGAEERTCRSAQWRSSRMALTSQSHSKKEATDMGQFSP